MARYKITALRRLPGVGEEITVERTPSLFARWCGATTKTLKFQGSGTVWHLVPSGQRQGIFMEGLLCDLVVGYKMRQVPD
jgi:hypothetical protein